MDDVFNIENFNIIQDTELKYQPMLPETRAIIFNIFRNYLATPEQKEKIKQMIAKEKVKSEIKKKKQYNTENIFKTKTQPQTQVTPVKKI